MTSSKRLSQLFYLSFAVLYLIMLLPIESAIKIWMPDTVLVWITAWIIIEPKMLGISKIAVAGILVDTLMGTPLGIHVISYILIGLLCFRVRSTFRFYPLLQQTMLFALYGLLNALILYWLNSLLAHQQLGWDYWGQVAGFALCWPVIFVLTQYSMRADFSTHS